MKKLGLLVMPLMGVSLLASCSQPTPTPVVDVAHTFHFLGTNCTINGESDYSHDIFEKDKDVQYTIVPNAGYNLPETVEGVEYNPTNGVITISEIKSDIELRVEAIHIPQPGTTHTIHLDPAGGTITSETILKNLPDSEPVITAPTISRDGYDASEVKWYTEPDGGGEEFKFGPKGTGTDVITDYFLHAKWGNVRQYTVHFKDFDEKEILSDQYPNYNDQVQRPSAPTKEGYNFVDWYKEDKTTLYDFSTRLTSDDTEFTIYAKYEKINCNITYITNGGTLGSTHIDSVEYGSSISTAPSISRDGYDANQVTWWLDSAMTSEQFTFGTTLVKADINLYAKWGNVKQYTVHFKDIESGATLSQDQKVNYNDRAQRPSNPIKAEYTFDDWYANKDKTQKYAFPRLTGDQLEIEVWGSFNPQVLYNVTFNAGAGEYSDGKTITMKCGPGTNIVSIMKYLSVPTLADNTFAYYEYENKDEAIDYDDAIFSDVTFIAKYYPTSQEATSDLSNINWKTIKNIAVTGDPARWFNIGAEKEITLSIDGVKQPFNHTVRIIDFKHDFLADENRKAGITFEFANIITKSVDHPIPTLVETSWDESYNYDYRKSLINTKLNDESIDADSIINMIPEDLRNNIKPVNKKVGVSNDDGQTYTALSFEENECPKLFLLSTDENSFAHPLAASNEGTIYKYYVGHETDQSYRIKLPVGGSLGSEFYWMRSPIANYNLRTNALAISFDGKVGPNAVGNALNSGVVPAFCI